MPNFDGLAGPNREFAYYFQTLTASPVELRKKMTEVLDQNKSVTE